MRGSALTALAMGMGMAFSATTWAGAAVAAEYAAHPAYRHCPCSSQWAHRQYWEWDHRPIWDDPWVVLKPNFWGSATPHLVPADIWAHKWHLPSVHDWRAHHRHARLDP